MESRNRFLGIDSANLFSLAGWFNNPIPTQFLAPIYCFKNTASESTEKAALYLILKLDKNKASSAQEKPALTLVEKMGFWDFSKQIIREQIFWDP